MCANICGPQRINPNDFRDVLVFFSALPCVLHFWFIVKGLNHYWMVCLKFGKNIHGHRGHVTANDIAISVIFHLVPPAFQLSLIH